jgi:hypothetical protein
VQQNVEMLEEELKESRQMQEKLSGDLRAVQSENA